MIDFSVFASLSFAISGSLALYMVLQFVGWFISMFDSAEGFVFRPARR